MSKASKALKENYIIRIKSRIEQDGETEQIELMTRGSFSMRDGSYYITYRETETTGYEGNVTTLKIAADASRVALLRFGPQASQLIIEKGRPDDQELREASAAAKICGLEYVSRETFALPRELGHREILLFKKTGKPSIKLPRRNGLAKTSPLGVL